MYFIGEANGMQYVSSTLGSLIISTIPIFSALGAWLILKEKISLSLILGLLISTGGVAVMSLGSDDLSATLKGVLFLLVAVFAGMFYGITVRELTLRYNALTIVAWQSLFGLLYFSPLFLYYDGSHFFSMQQNIQGLITIAAMSIFASVGAFMLYTGVIRDLGVIKSNVFTNLIPSSRLSWPI
jgi:drug/metabolite transporter (DMT)-like permease